MQPTLVQRLENGAIAVAILLGFIVTGAGWWWPLVLFLVFDLSALGYLVGPKPGAALYNMVHAHIGPAALAIAALAARMAGGDTFWLIFVAALWAFHVAADRALGYGLKYPDSFGHTHLGMIGKARRVDHDPAGSAR